jgi:hypothetical protein
MITWKLPAYFLASPTSPSRFWGVIISDKDIIKLRLMYVTCIIIYDFKIGCPACRG